MTSLSFILSARRWMDHQGRIARIGPPFWPVVAVALMVWGLAFCDAAETPAPTSWVGSTRDEVVAILGKPVSALQRGETEVLMYPDNVRLEIRDGEVVSYRSGNSAVLVKSDGTRYAPSDRGKVTRLVATPEPAAGPEDPALPDDATSVPAAVPPMEAEVAEGREEALELEEDAEALNGPGDATEPEEWISPAAQGELDPDMQMLKMADNYAEHGVLTDEEIKPTPPWFTAVSAIVGGLFHFGFTVIVLRMAITFVDLPCYMPDVLKVSALYVVIREGVDGLGGLGGHWEWLRLFRAADVLSFFALCILLFQFKIALQGITALKIAVATKVATFILMIIVGLALTFGLAALA